MSTRLTNYARRQVVAAMLKISFPQITLDKLEIEEGDLMLTLRDWSLGSHKEAIMKLPKKFLIRKSSISVNSIPEYQYNSFYVYDDEAVICPIGGIIFEDLPKKLQNKILSFLKRKKEAKEQLKDLERELNSILTSCSSTGRLKEALPEAIKFLPESYFRGHLPAVSKDVIDNVKKQINFSEAA